MPLITLRKLLNSSRRLRNSPSHIEASDVKIKSHLVPTYEELIKQLAVFRENFDAPEDWAISIAPDRSLRGKIEITEPLKATAYLNFATNRAEIATFATLHNRGKGYSRRFLQSFYRATQAISFQHIQVTATNEGRVVWAGMGFRPPEAHWNTLKPIIVEAIKSYNGDEIDKEGKEQLLKEIEIIGSNSLHLISRLRFNWEDHLKPTCFVCTVLYSLNSWNGEIEIGDEYAEEVLF